MSAQTQLAHLNCRVWYDHVRTEANPADPLSPEGPPDAWVASKLNAQEWVLDNRLVEWAAIAPLI
eukprot:5869724-Amphidinium_carterae.1